MAKQYILVARSGGKSCTLKDGDLWGLECALQHGLHDGYFTDSAEWAKAMYDQLVALHGYSEPPDAGSEEEDVDDDGGFLASEQSREATRMNQESHRHDQ